MRILVISPEFPPSLSGIGDYAYHLTQNLKLQGHEMMVLTSKEINLNDENLNGVKILRAVKTWDWTAWDTVKTNLQMWSPSLVHLQYMNLTFHNHPFVNFLPFLIKRHFPKIKTLTTYHEFAAPWFRLALLPLLLMSDAHIVTNEHHENKLTKILSRLGKKTPLLKIPLAANILPHPKGQKNRMLTREQLGVSPSEILMVRFGILHDISVTEIIKICDALGELRRKEFPIRFLLIGKEEPAAKAMLLQKIKTAGLEDIVILKTNVSSELISAFLYAADLGLALYPDGISEKRSAFISLVAHELPILATRHGKLPSEFTEGENLVTVSHAESSQAWSVAIMHLIENPVLRQKLQEGCRKISARHDWREIAQSTSALYLKLMETP